MPTLQSIPMACPMPFGKAAVKAAAASAAMAAAASAAAAVTLAAPAAAVPVAPTPLVAPEESWAILGDSTDALLALLPAPEEAAGASDVSGGSQSMPLLSSADDLDCLLPWDADASFLNGSFQNHLCTLEGVTTATAAEAAAAASAASVAAVKPPTPQLQLLAPPRREGTPSLTSGDASPTSSYSYSVEGFNLFTGDSLDSLRSSTGPLGLRLRKSASLAKLVAESLARGSY